MLLTPVLRCLTLPVGTAHCWHYTLGASLLSVASGLHQPCLLKLAQLGLGFINVYSMALRSVPFSLQGSGFQVLNPMPFLHMHSYADRLGYSSTWPASTLLTCCQTFFLCLSAVFSSPVHFMSVLSPASLPDCSWLRVLLPDLGFETYIIEPALHH